jgi:hypothetical protein
MNVGVRGSQNRGCIKLRMMFSCAAFPYFVIIYVQKKGKLRSTAILYIC